MIILFILLLSFNALALESTDVMDVQIMKVYDKNILVLNRGLEDAIFRNDHIKITNQNGFIARGICIKSSMYLSHYKIYRVTRPQLVSKDALYQLRSINQSKIPNDMNRFKRVDLARYFRDYTDENVERQLKLQNKRIATYDLPERVADTTNYRRKSRSYFDSFVEDNFEDEIVRKDLSTTYFEVFASPFSFQTFYDQEESHYGARIYNRGRKYRYQLLGIERQRRITYPVARRILYNNKSTHYRADFEVNRVLENWSLVTFAQFDREKFGPIYYPHRFMRGAILGFKYHFWEDDPKDEYFEMSYSPALDLIEYNDLTNINNGSDSLRERDGYRHTFEARLRTVLTRNWKFAFDLYYAPFTQDFFGDVDWGDNMLDTEAVFSYKVSDNFYFDYSLQYLRDELRAETYNVRADNGISTVRFRYEVDL